MSNYKATPEQWKKVEESAAPSAVVTGGSTDSCILELRARVEALEALEAQASNYPEIPDSSTPPPVATDEERLMDRVSIAIMSVEDDDDDDDPSFKYTSAAISLGMDVNSLQARAAIIEVARWMRDRGWVDMPDALEQEAGR